MKQIDKIILQRYFEGRCTPEEELLVSAYLQQDDLSALHAYVDAEAATATDKLPAAEVADSLQAFHTARIAEQPVRKTIRWQRIVAAAAVVACIAAGAWLWKKQLSHAAAPLWASITNNNKNMQVVQLPDGTKIWLHPQAALSYDKNNYNDINRAVKLTGEAFFDVAHDADKPFTVQSGLVTTTVRGTAFNIEAYANEKDVRVILVRGKVEVTAKTWTYTLSPGQMMDYNNDKNNMEIKTISTGELADWTQDKLIFNDLPLLDVLKRLEENYNIRIICVNPSIVDNKRITGKYTRRSADEILNKILFIHGLQYQKQGGQYMIK
ncbi:MAG: FecR domain-containing protein [Filimonas sp.]|nr:FecR domain-containing protein [Filimonas sp.]